jgi:hypothetical protein
MSVYIENGYESRKHYLKCMSEDYDVPLDVVYSCASVLGKDEDFDGLICMLEDWETEHCDYCEEE